VSPLLAFFAEPFSADFMVRAFAAGVVVGGLCALIGVFVVQRGLAFIGDGLAHAAFGGIALGLLLEPMLARLRFVRAHPRLENMIHENTSWIALPFTILVALGIAYVLRRGRMRGDVATGVFFAVSFALGVLFLGLRPATARPVNVESVLFGSILAISPADLTTVVVVAALTTLVFGAVWSRLAYATFDPELAQISGVPVAALDYLLLALTALVIVIAVKTVGIALVSAFVVIPAATARMIGRRLSSVALISVALGAGGSALGLVLSYNLNVASGATIILTLGAGFGLALALASRWRRH
jgi:zinc transport system permease protein